jgi:tetratricopeptide (TPR) repeat protein
MRTIVLSCLVLSGFGIAFGESPDPPLDNARLPVSTLVREDIFAGWQENDMVRYARAEKNIEQLLNDRPRERTALLAWKGGTKLYRAVVAREAGNDAEFERYYQETIDLFAEAKKLGPRHPVVNAVVGGSFVLFGDRLPEKYREAAWAAGYENYQALWKMQGQGLDRLPLHIRGELLAGVAQSAHRTGRQEECNEFLDKIIEKLPDTGYEREAKAWKADPAAAGKGNISCKSCHDEGRLADRLAKLNGK